MTKRMTDVELERFREHLGVIAESGTESEVRAYVDEHFPRLPQDMQNEIIASLFLSSLKEETEDLKKAEKSL